MTDLSVSLSRLPGLWARLDKVWLTIVAIPLVLLLVAPGEVVPVVGAAAGSIAHTAVFIAFAVLAVAWLKATGAESLLARAFEGSEGRMIVLAALAGGLAPFCSCEVIPFIAAMLALGVPLSAVMAFWLASPVMDPAMFLITAGTLGAPFAVAKAVAAVSIGLAGGAAVWAARGTALFADPLKTAPVKSCCGCGAGPAMPFEGRPVWRFWTVPERRRSFAETARDNALFLLKWLTLAYLIEALMIRHIPADAIGALLGGDGPMPVLLGAVLGGPAYLNGYAAVPLVDALMQQGMSAGAAMSFMLAGGISCIPAALAVWALVKPRVFAAYLGLAFTGSLIAGFAWGALA